MEVVEIGVPSPDRPVRVVLLDDDLVGDEFGVFVLED